MGASRQPLRFVLLRDEAPLPAWQLDAIEEAIRRGSCRPVMVLRIRGRAPRRRHLRHVLYYCLRLAVRPQCWRTAPEPAEWATLPSQTCEPDVENGWWRLPEDAARGATDSGAHFILNCCTGLLSGSLLAATPLGIWSWHHGDPAAYRGRPAGFWELTRGELWTGAVLQRLTDGLDQGPILAQGRYRAIAHSYTATLETLYRGSALLLAKACLAVQQPVEEGIGKGGKLYRLPSNFSVAAFAARIGLARLRRILYGAFGHKAWFVARAPTGSPLELDADAMSRATQLNAPAAYRFLADPISLAGAPERALCEGLNASTGRGEILLLERNGDARPLIRGEGHLSYPFSFTFAGQTWVTPERASWGPPLAYRLEGDRIAEQRPLGPPERLLDPTLFEHAGRWWLFATQRGALSLNDLYLWHADTPFGPWQPHPMNPVVQDPTRARPAGRLFAADGRTYRPGQICVPHYGRGVTLCEVLEMSPQHYVERPALTLQPGNLDGLHTWGWIHGQLLFDACHERFSATAWLDRIRARRASGAAAA